jgi:energy-coupling factor transporter ATP-binding protein EcfA2
VSAAPPGAARDEARAGVPPSVTALSIQAVGLGFRYLGADRPALRDVTFELPAGQVLLVVGPSGSGKSTLARAIAGLVPGDFPGELTGVIRLGTIGPGDDPGAAETHPGDPRVGVLFQDPASQLVMELAGDDVAFGLENRAWSLDAMRARVPSSLADVGLPGFEARRTNRLSGGEQQRLALAGVLAARPGLLVLDEPTANLDPTGTDAVFDRVRGLAHQHAATIVLVEHRVDAAWRLADRVLALGPDGAPIDVGAPDEVLVRSRDRLDRAGVWRPDLPKPRRRRTAIGSGPAEPVLRIEEAWFGFEPGQPTLHGVSLAVARGERVAIVGANGSGKTTLLRLAVGLIRPSAGAVSLTGRDPSRLRARELAMRVGYVVQDPELGFMADTVAQESLLGLDEAAQAHARELAARLDLDLDRFGPVSPYLLSGGEQRRLSLVTALARRPPVLVLDEPTYGQDRHGHDALLAALDELVDGGTAVVAATHDQRFVDGFADRVVTLDDGWLASG